MARKDCNRHRANPSASGNVKGIQLAAVQGLFRVLGIVWDLYGLGFKVGFVKALAELNGEVLNMGGPLGDPMDLGSRARPQNQ